MLYPLIFEPIFKDRIWGGRQLATVYQKPVPAGTIGESWEISDRPGDSSKIVNGELAGETLEWLMRNWQSDLLGPDSKLERFPLLVKILDAQSTLSLQVHPPPEKARALGGEAKTEMWYVARALPGAELFAGLKRGVTSAEFERRTGDGTVAECFHRIPVQEGDAMFLPSGRVHALGGGLLIFEIQQNSDTTYRVFDWNRLDAQGQPRDLHVPQSLASIDFQDFEPSLVPRDPKKDKEGGIRPLVDHPLFKVEQVSLPSAGEFELPAKTCSVIAVLAGSVEVEWGQEKLNLMPGQFALFPVNRPQVRLKTAEGTQFLRAQPGVSF